MSDKRLHLAAGDHPPQPDRRIGAPRSEPKSVGAESHRSHFTVVAVESANLLTGVYVPQLDCAVAAPRNEALTVRAERNRVDACGVTAKRAQRQAALNLPHLDSLVEKPRSDQPSVGTDCDRSHIVSRAYFVLLVEKIIDASQLLLNLRESFHESNARPVRFRCRQPLLDVLKHARKGLPFFRRRDDVSFEHPGIAADLGKLRLHLLHQVIQQRLNVRTNVIENLVALRALVVARVASDCKFQTCYGLVGVVQYRLEARLLIMCFEQIGIERDRFAQMREPIFELVLYRANDSGEVMSLRRLARVVRSRILRGPPKVFERIREVNQVIQANVGDRSKHREVGIVALLCFQKVGQRLFVPSVQISFLGSASIGTRLSFELGETDFVKYVAERVLVHFDLPYDVAQQKIEVGIKPIDSSGELFKPEFDTVVARSVTHASAERTQP